MDSKQNRTPPAAVGQGLALEYATLGWNVVGTGIMLAAAIQARSVALAGFGLDSLIEILASLVVVWQLKGSGPGRQRRALRVLGGAFILLALYILVQSLHALVARVKPAPSPWGVLWLVLTVVVMLGLALGKGRVGRALENAVLLTESRVTLVDAYLAASVLLGVVLNAAVGWWWADSAAGLVIVFYGFREGLHAWQESRGE